MPIGFYWNTQSDAVVHVVGHCWDIAEVRCLVICRAMRAQQVDFTVPVDHLGAALKEGNMCRVYWSNGRWHESEQPTQAVA